MGSVKENWEEISDSTEEAFQALALKKKPILNKDMTLDKIYPPQTINLELERVITIELLGDWLKEKVRDIYSNRLWNENIKHRQAVEFMIEYIHDYYFENINLCDLSEKVYISRNYLSSIFKQSTGESFNLYLTRVRMEKAKSLLMEGKYLIYEIAEMVGYKNVPYFSTVFKKYTGINPSDLVK